MAPSFLTHEFSNLPRVRTFCREVIGCFYDHIPDDSKIHVLDMDLLQRQHGELIDLRKWYLYRQPYTETFCHRIGTALGRLIRAANTPPKKCLVLDCDDTLWGGVVGEVGIGSIALGDEFPGSAFKDFQQQLIHLHDRGVLLCLASKNNEDDVWEVFDHHDAMILERKHIASWRINWNSKSDNIMSIAEELKISLGDMVFIDDSRTEVEKVCKRIPGVTSIQIPDEPAFITRILQKSYLFDSLVVTEEDENRTKMIQSERGRRSSLESMTQEEFLRTLSLQVEKIQITEAHLGRVAQLVNKTNQFNLTTRRRTLEEIRTIMALDNWSVYAIRVFDKFGEYGLVGVSIIEKTEIWKIDTFLLSCRVLGRGVETAFLSLIVGDAKSEGVREMIGEFVPTTKNQPAATFFRDYGFHESEKGVWAAGIDRVLPCPDHIKIFS